MKSESINELIQREWKLLLTLFLAGVLFYIYPTIHQQLTVDNDTHVLTQTFDWYLRSKRWGICLIQKVFFLRTVVPSFWVIINMVFLALASVIVCDIFKFSKPWLKYLYGFLFISFPQYSYMLRYACTADAVAIGILLIVLGMRCFVSSNSWKSNLAVFFLFIGGLSIYASIILIPLTIFLLLSSIKLSTKEISLTDWLKQAIRLGVITVLAYLSYHFISIGILSYYSLPTDTPKYFTSMIHWGEAPLHEILHRILKLIGQHWEGKNYLMEKVFVLTWIPFAIVIFNLIRSETTLALKLLSLSLLVATMIAPFVQIIVLGGHNTQSHSLLAQGVLFASLWCVGLQQLPRIKPEWVMTGMFVLFAHNGYRVTQTFHWDVMIETAEKNLISRIFSRLDDMEINVEQHRFIVVGHYSVNPEIPSNKWSFINDHSGTGFVRANKRSAKALVLHGFTTTLPTYPSHQQIHQLEPVIASMPIWPSRQSIALIDDVVIIKLSNNYNLEKDYPSWSLPKK